MRQTIYFDNNATTFMDSEVAGLLAELYRRPLANPGSQHRSGRQALALLEEAKSDLLSLVDAPREGMSSAEVILTSGGTESNNLALFGLTKKQSDLVIIGAIEHPSILEAAQHPSFLAPTRILPVDRHGIYDLDRLHQWLAEIYSGQDRHHRSVSLVSLMLGNNETGAIQDLRRACAICSEFGVPVHSDVTQALGKIPFSMRETGLSAISFTAHKIHGPVGVGALIVNREVKPEPMLIGGGQQLELRAGTESVILAVAMARALKLTSDACSSGVYDTVGLLRDEFEKRLLELPGTSVTSLGVDRLPHTSNVAFEGLDRQAMQMALDLEGLACSTGSACASGSSRPSHVLQAMALKPSVLESAMRFSFSRFTTQDEINTAIEKIEKVSLRLRRQKSLA
jgi:cysteine desulfurase